MAETVKGLNIKLSLDGRDLENELKEIQSDLKEQQRDLKAINTNLKYDSSNVELWKQKQSKLNDILQTTKKKLETQNQELNKAKQATFLIGTLFSVVTLTIGCCSITSPSITESGNFWTILIKLLITVLKEAIQ